MRSFKKMIRIGIVICYFGRWPGWFSLFIKSCGYNRAIDWLVFADHVFDTHQFDNIKYVPFTLMQFNKLASKKLGLTVKIINPYKLCDFKPTYGKVFEDYLRGYDFWGYSDIDMFYGKIETFISKNVLKNYDIINSYENFISGAFCLFKNNNYINSLYKNIQNFEGILQDPNHWGIDENLLKNDEFQRRNLKNTFYYMQYFIYQLSHNPLIILHWLEFRYQFQWFLKKKKLYSQKKLKDMTEVIWYNKLHGHLKVWSKNIVFSDKYLERLGERDWHVKWDKGSLFINRLKKYLFAFHIINSKNNRAFLNIGEINNNYEKIIITSKGFRIE